MKATTTRTATRGRSGKTDFDAQVGASVFELALRYRAAEYRFQKYRQQPGADEETRERMLDDLMKRKQMLFAVVDTIVSDVRAQAGGLEGRA